MSRGVSCPEANDLQRFVLGQVALPDLLRVEAHLSECGRCLESLDKLNAEDTLVDAVRAQSGASQEPDHATVVDLILRLEKLPAAGAVPATPVANREQATIAPTMSSGSAGSADPTGAPYSFLAPAQGPGEIGRLGPYRVLEMLGCGGMGVVFQAEDPHLQRMVALKVMLPGVASSELARVRFLREARAVAAIEHDHIVPIYQVSEDYDVPFLAMQLLKGESLDDRLKREPRLPVDQVMRIGREIAEGLAAAHERGLIHRDIKPGNI